MTELRGWQCFNYQNSAEKFTSVNLQVSGFIYGDIRFEDGTYVVTSRIISANGRSVVTESGTHYWLTGDPDSAWMKWCNEKGWDLDPENPVGNISPVLFDKN